MLPGKDERMIERREELACNLKTGVVTQGIQRPDDRLLLLDDAL